MSREQRVGILKPRRRVLLFFGLLLATLLAAYLVFGASDQRRVLSVLRAVFAAANALPGDTEALRERRVRATLAKHALPTVSLSIAELGVFEGADEIATLLEQAQGVSLRVSIDQSDVQAQPTRARATLQVSIEINTPGVQRRQVRTVAAELVKRDGHFLVSALRSSAESTEQPEPRP